MKKIFLGLLFASVLLAGCKKEKQVTEELQLEGAWQVQKVEFTTEEAVWPEEENIPALGYAPRMYTMYLGFEFFPQKVASGEGNKLTLHNSINNGEPDVDYWYWNYTDDKKSFETVQLPAFPAPYDFSVKNVKNAKQSEDKQKVTFEAEVNSRVPGGTLQDIQLLPVKITLVKGEPNVHGEVFILGEKFE